MESSMKFEEINPSVWTPKQEGDAVEGVLVRKDKEVGPNKSNSYHLEKNSEKIMVWGTSVLDDRMAYVNPGDYIRITYKGTKPNSRNQQTKIFKVERAIISQKDVKNIIDIAL